MGPTFSSTKLSSLNDVYRERITKILGKNTARLTNLTNISQDLYVEINCKKKCKICVGENGISITQKQAAKIMLVTEVSQSQINDMVSMIETDLSNKSSQTYKEVSEFLSNMGVWKDTDVNTEIINRIKDIVRNEITLENVVNILNEVELGQSNKIVWNLGENTEIGGKQCVIRQDIFLDFFSESIVKMVVENATEDQSIVRMLSDAKQDTQIEARGLDGVLKSVFSGIVGLVVVAVIVAIVWFKMQTSLVPTDSLTEAAKKRPGLVILVVLITILIIGSIIYFPVAKVFSIWPFSGERTLWKCEKADGIYTGKCIAGKFERGFKSKEECELSPTCEQYWGCEFKDGTYTGKCMQYTSASNGPMRTRKECEEAISQGRMCTLKYGPALTPEGLYKQPPECIQYQDPKLGSFKTQLQCMENKDKFRNKWKCSNGKCVEAHPSTDWAMYTKESDCKAGCKRQ